MALTGCTASSPKRLGCGSSPWTVLNALTGCIAPPKEAVQPIGLTETVSMVGLGHKKDIFVYYMGLQRFRHSCAANQGPPEICDGRGGTEVGDLEGLSALLGNIEKSALSQSPTFLSICMPSINLRIAPSHLKFTGTALQISTNFRALEDPTPTSR